MRKTRNYVLSIIICGISFLASTSFAIDTIEVLYPNGDDTQGMSRSAGSDNFALVDELVPDGDTTYCYSVIAVDIYDLSPPTTNEGTITGIAVWVRAKELGGAGQVTGGLGYNGSWTTASAQAITTSYASYAFWFPNNPDTGSAWTWEELKDTLLAVDVMELTFTYNVRVTKVYAAVYYTLPSGEELRPDSDTATLEIDITTDGGGVHYTEIDEASPPDTSDYIGNFNNAVEQKDIYTLSNHAVGSGNINNVTLVGLFSATNGFGYFKLGVEMGGIEYLGNEQRMSNPLETYYSQTYFSNPNTGTSWTWANVDDIKPILVLRCTAAGFIFAVCYQNYVIVDYTETTTTTTTVPELEERRIMLY